MDKKEKRQLTETDICDLFITPAIKKAGWDPMTQIRREYALTPGPVVVHGNISSRNRAKRKFADYVLLKKTGLPIAVIEAKKNKFSVSHGMQQALGYAEILEIPSAYSSNGDAFASHNKIPQQGEAIEGEIPLDQLPSPDELWQRYKRFHHIEDQHETLVTQDYYEDSSGKEPRYYQLDAINRTIEAVANGQKRILLVMATGTGKTYTTFQIIWRLWKAKAVKRILFLVDRNILATQTINNDFKPFAGSITQIKNRKIDPAYEVHVGLYQAMTGSQEADKIFNTVSANFFDLIVVDECHRGSAKEDSAWREILDYFSNAVQIGLTATPKETEYVSSSTYFGEPVYTYSLKQGIEDGFLAPYKVIKVNIDKDVEGWTPPVGMTDDYGEVIEQRSYNQTDMDRQLILRQRTQLVAERVMAYLNATDPYAKTIIFCEDINHAERMRSAITNAAGQLAIDHPKYVMRITGDNPEGKAELDNFIDKEERFPVIATTSELLTTGVDAKTCKLIVLDKTIRSMTTFKQIIGRGTRIEEDYNKFFFTIIDFKKATELFRDPEFDGEPVVIYEAQGIDDMVPSDAEDAEGGKAQQEEKEARYKFHVSGVSVNIKEERVEYLRADGELVTASYRDYTRNQILNTFASLDTFLSQWQESDKKTVIVKLLEEQGIIFAKLAADMGKDYGAFDLICISLYTSLDII